MSEKEKKEIAEMVETAKHLAVHDPQAFMIAKSNMEILKIRADMDKQYEFKTGNTTGGEAADQASGR